MDIDVWMCESTGARKEKRVLEQQCASSSWGISGEGYVFFQRRVGLERESSGDAQDALAGLGKPCNTFSVTNSQVT